MIIPSTCIEGITGSALACGPDARTWALADDTVLHLGSGPTIFARHPAPGPIHHVAFAPTGDRLLACPYVLDLATTAWSAPTDLDDALLAGLDEPAAPGEVAILAGATAADGRELALVTRPESSRRERLVLVGTDGSFRAQLADGFDEIRAVTTSTRHVAAGGSTVRVWERSSQQPVAQLDLGRLIRALAFDATGDVLAAVVSDGSAVAWEPSSSRPAEQWMAHAGEASAVAVHPRLPVLATGGEDGAVRLWWCDGSPASAAQLGGWVVALAFAPSGATLLAATWERPPHLWTLDVDVADKQPQAPGEVGDS